MEPTSQTMCRLVGTQSFLGGAREVADRKVVGVAQLADGVQRLMNIPADEVNDELQRIASLRGDEAR